jgi:paraquat-inducible protein A
MSMVHPREAARRSPPVPEAASAAESARGADRAIGPLLLLSLALVPATWWLPLFTARVPFLWRQDVSIATGLVELRRLDLVLCAAVFFFSVLAPLAKGVALAWVWYRVPTARAARLLNRLSLLGKLSMTEMFLLAVVIVGLKGVGIGKVEVSWGLHAFVSVLVLSFAASTWAWAALARATQPSRGPATGRP